ncbi:MAG: SUMF1/EgtB/PvdO family nonheme iron enzyme [Phycisphaeraceae bacterium]|nr:MAG: SUMF1/EgtB/PvdO family nonheme iron enzyme [Phycisphaeraceae bacterium]
MDTTRRSQTSRTSARLLSLLGLALPLSLAQHTHASQPAPAAPASTKLAPIEQEIPGAALSITLIPIPGDETKGIKPFYISATELTWPAFDPFVYRLDEPNDTSGSDATTRPSKPYLPPDRGFGHDGYAAISMSFHSAQMYCKWLSAKSGKTYRLPTEAEWELACGSEPASATLTEAAWFADNADGKPHPVASKAANAFGLHDMLGNVQEWCLGADGKPVTKGGSYRDPAELLTPTHRAPQTSAWNSSDPQIPKSKWWLSDGPFVGFRIVREAD